ncbi:glycosyltransferase [Spirosoma aerolatum]|uniref:glycosyltransferase n=1 Tax=Spirosoma aerolatum TaxID=1211326 RepID=UPI0009AE1874|nr:nucleotide disphospho-sugar-binding domain-containing protein [Spirosoma aerolatum]
MTPQRILFATMPMDGHFSPLTGLAVHLKQAGHDVRWYVGGHYGQKVCQLGLHHYPFKQAQTVNQYNLDSLFPERTTLKSPLARLRFDIHQVFLLRTPEFIEDLTEIHAEWEFDILVHDVGFTGGVFAKHILGVKTVGVGVVPLAESDAYVGASGLGLRPRMGWFGQRFLGLVRYLIQGYALNTCHTLYNRYRRQYGMPAASDFVFDDLIRTADLYLQSGVPGFEYPRQRISSNIRFVGPLLPYSKGKKRVYELLSKLSTFKRIILVTQGTIERDVEKLIVPTLEAFKNEPDTLVIATTGGSQTNELRVRYPIHNALIEDYIDFNVVMPYANVYITNGGYGGVMLGLKHKLPIIAAGIHEGKNEIAARLGYCQVGIDLKTERPKPGQIYKAVDTILSDITYRENVQKLGVELASYNTNELAERYITALYQECPQFISEEIIA